MWYFKVESYVQCVRRDLQSRVPDNDAIGQWRIQDLQTGGQGRAPQARVSKRRRRRGWWGVVWGGAVKKIFDFRSKMSTSSAF